jgi:hypothetical protein
VNAVSPPSLQGDDLLAIIDFKWLMIGTGHHVHVEQLQSDPDYARTCLALGASSGIAALRVSAGRVARRLGLTLS